MFTKKSNPHQKCVKKWFFYMKESENVKLPKAFIQLYQAIESAKWQVVSMGRAPCCDKANVKRGPWSPDEDNTLRNYLEKHGTGGNWIALPHKAGLKRCGKSCRLRWLNYLRPDIKHGGFTEEEDKIICSLYSSLGSRWSVIAARLPGRTDNDVKNYWNTKLKKKLLAGKMGLDKSSNNELTISGSSTSNTISGQFSASIPEAEARANGNSDYYLNTANGSTSSSYMTDMQYQQNYDYPGQVLDRIDQFSQPGIMEYSTSTANNNYSMSSSQQVSSSLFNSSSFPLGNSTYAALSSKGGAEDQGILLDLDFDGPHHYLFSGSSFQEKK